MNNIGRIKLRHLAISIVFVLGCFTLRGQTLEEAKELYLEGRYAEALPIFQIEYRSKPNDASLNHWLGVCLYETGNIRDAEKHLAYASQKKIPEAYIYLGELYTKMYRFDEAEKEFEKYRKIKRRDKEALARLEEKQAYADRLKRLVKRTEDIQIIDSIAVAKNKFLSAYRLSASSGSLVPMNEFFSDYPNSTLPVFINEKKDKIYFSQQDPERGLEICSMEKLLDVGQPVVVVSRAKRLQLRAEVSEKYADRLPALTGANFKPSYGDTLYKLSDLNGRLISYGRAVDDNSFYIPVIFDFDNRGDIIPGSYVEVFLLSLPLMDVIAVPVSALTEEQGLHFVYVQLEKEIFKKQEVRIGLSDGERVRILSGLKEGDRVVTKGTYQVKLAATASVIPEGHSHAH
jgi:multidrug efflux pump subunit AcrA (membrane-fusion protein)